MVLALALNCQIADAENFNWEAWAKKEYQSLPPRISNGSKVGQAKFLVWRACDKMAEFRIRPNNSYSDRAYTAFLTRRRKGTLGEAPLSADQGTCGDVAEILGLVLSAPRDAAGNPLLGIPTLALTEVRKDSAWKWNPLAVNNNHAAIALAIDGNIYVFDPWMASYRDQARAESYGDFGSGHEWNGKNFKDWAGEMYDLDYRIFTLSTFQNLGLPDWKQERIAEVLALYLDDLERLKPRKNEPVVPTPPKPASVPSVTGSWQGFYSDGKETVRFAVALSQKGQRLSGNITFHLVGKIEKGTVTGKVDSTGKVTFTWRRAPQNIISKTFTGSLKKGGKNISGRLTTSSARSGEFRIVR